MQQWAEYEYSYEYGTAAYRIHDINHDYICNTFKSDFCN